jgi:hypothetical protein
MVTLACALTTVAVAWVLAQEGVTSALIGASRPDQLGASLAAAELKLDPELRKVCDELWLERARAFAMHAAAQVARAREAHGRGRFTLWTGDPGVALYLADCLAGGGELPLP